MKRIRICVHAASSSPAASRERLELTLVVSGVIVTLAKLAWPAAVGLNYRSPSLFSNRGEMK